MVDRIIELMNERGLTAKKLTTDTKLSSSSISDWKKGKGKPSLDAIIKLSKYFGVTSDYLLGLSETKSENSNLENEPLTENENRLLEIFKSLSDDNQIVLIGDAIKLKREQTYEEALSTNNQYKQAK